MMERAGELAAKAAAQPEFKAESTWFHVFRGMIDCGDFARIRQRLKAGLPCNSCRPHSDGQPLHVALASELFAGCFDTMSIARQLAFSLSTGHEPADSVVLAAFEAARILELDTNALYRDMQSIPFFQR